MLLNIKNQQNNHGVFASIISAWCQSRTREAVKSEVYDLLNIKFHAGLVFSTRISLDQMQKGMF